ncbi:Acyl-homoserine lactone acylase QuiP [Diplonema papillatum]|nr:Acyl-homoserine lactone acylase QuiP [Diplonema papillatum]KAJ9439328.1 Acyl-homoserine lactone acylase QuiP [Diplonema papillatum]
MHSKLRIFLGSACMMLSSFAHPGGAKPAPGSEIELSRDFDGAPVSGPVYITRDEKGLTHISAETKKDALFGQGFAQAQDRLYQIEYNRLLYSGNLAAHIGAGGRGADYQTRTLNFRGAAEDMCNLLPAADVTLLQSFVDGMNFYLKTNTQRPPEFLYMSKFVAYGYHEPEPFKIVDVCGAVRLSQWSLGRNINKEIARFKVWWNSNMDYADLQNLYVNNTNQTGTILSAEDLDISEADMVEQRAYLKAMQEKEAELYAEDGYFGKLRSQLNPNYPSTTTSSSARAGRAARAMEEAAAADGHGPKPLDILDLLQDEASNSWVAKGFGTDAKSVQASDPHLALAAPSTWYFTHLHYEGHDVSGCGLNGVPGVQIGKTNTVSWGITMSQTDLADLFLLVPSATNPQTHYTVNDRDVAFSPRPESFAVKGEASPVSFVAADTIYGPVGTAALGLPMPGYLNFAVRSRGLEPDSSGMTGFLNMLNPEVDTAVKVRDEIFRKISAPAFSVPVTDHTGQMVYAMSGKHPIRSFGHTGWVPTVGNGSFDWGESVPMDELPTKVIPAREASGFIAAANQKIHPDGYKYILCIDYVYPHRGKRVHELLEASLADLSDVTKSLDIQVDTQSNSWVSLFKPLVTSAGLVVENPEDPTKDAITLPAVFKAQLSTAGAAWLQRLTDWDGRSSVGATEPTFFWYWLNALGRYPLLKTGQRWATEEYPYRTLANPSEITVKECAAFYTSDPTTSPSMKTTSTGAPQDPCFWLAVDAFNALAAQYSDPFSTPVWGVDVSLLDTSHALMQFTPLGCIFGYKAGKGGDSSAVNVATPSNLVNFKVSSGPSMRQVINWATPDRMYFALPGGESGNPLSPRYRNLLQTWAQDEYDTIRTEDMSRVFNSTHQVLSPLGAPWW